MKGLFRNLKVDFTAVELDEVGMLFHTIENCILCWEIVNHEEPSGLSNVSWEHAGCAVEGEEVMDALLAITHRRTVPQVFIKGEFIGGCDGEWWT